MLGYFTFKLSSTIQLFRITSAESYGFLLM